VRDRPLRELTTERLVLRRFVWEDLEDLARISADPVTRRLMWSGVLSRERTAHNIREWAREYERGLGLLAVVHGAEGRLIGQCGLEEEGDIFELGYMLDKDYWGMGLATEAAKAVLEHGFGELELPLIWATAHAENAASRRVMEKLGMTYQRSECHPEGEEVFYAISRQEFLSPAESGPASEGRSKTDLERVGE
jgi:RimJ/RimL family protein N-acetyltransferase